MGEARLQDALIFRDIVGRFYRKIEHKIPTLRTVNELLKSLNCRFPCASGAQRIRQDVAQV